MSRYITVFISDHISHLSVEQNVDDRVVQGSALGEEGRSGHEHWPKRCSLVDKNVPGHAGVGNPAHQEGDDHDDDHARDLFLCPLGGFRPLLQGCSLSTKTERKRGREGGRDRGRLLTYLRANLRSKRKQNVLKLTETEIR